ncbi:MAG: cell division protein SepF [Anaerovorax sp.]
MGDGLFSKLKMLVGIEEIDEEEEEKPEEKPMNTERKSLESKNSYMTARPGVKEEKDSRIAPVQNKLNSATNQFKLVVTEPKSFEECPRLVDSLKSRKPVIINLEKMDSDVARKIFDFLSGATYALNGNVQKVANNIFIFAPDNVDVAANIDHKAIDFGSGPKNLWK